MTLWLPPGVDLGDRDGPQPDERMASFLGGISPSGEPMPMTYRALHQHASTWAITRATPEGPARLLAASRLMFAHGFYVYEFISCSAAWSVFAVEAALKLRLGAPKKSFHDLVGEAAACNMIAPELADILETGRRIRNDFVHEGKQPAWTFGMAGPVIGASFKIVAELYPDLPEPRSN